MWTVVPHVYNVSTAPHIQSWIFDWTYLRCSWRYADVCMRVILQILCQIQSPSSGLRYMNSGPGHILCIYSSAYSDFNVHLNVSALLLEISRQLLSRILQTWCQIQRTSTGLRYVNCGPGHIQCIYSSIYSDFNIHLIESALLLYISRQINVRYTAFLVPNTAHILQFTLCDLWSRPYTKYSSAPHI
jgi:hypothetical protein